MGVACVTSYNIERHQNVTLLMRTNWHKHTIYKNGVSSATTLSISDGEIRPRQVDFFTIMQHNV